MCSLQEDFFSEDVMPAAGGDAADSSSGFEQDKKRKGAKKAKAAKRAAKAASGDCKQLAVGSRAQVFHGTAKHTSGGLTKSDLMKNKHGAIVSKKKSAKAKSAMRKCKNPFALVIKGMKAAGIKRERGADGRFKKLSKAQKDKLHSAMGVAKKKCDKKKAAKRAGGKKKKAPCPQKKSDKKLLKRAAKKAK